MASLSKWCSLISKSLPDDFFFNAGEKLEHSMFNQAKVKGYMVPNLFNETALLRHWQVSWVYGFAQTVMVR